MEKPQVYGPVYKWAGHIGFHVEHHVESIAGHVGSVMYPIVENRPKKRNTEAIQGLN